MAAIGARLPLHTLSHSLHTLAVCLSDVGCEWLNGLNDQHCGAHRAPLRAVFIVWAFFFERIVAGITAIAGGK